MSTLKYSTDLAGRLMLVLSLGLVSCASPPDSGLSTAPSQGPGLGRVASASLLQRMDRSIMSNGEGLPVGSGTVAQGEKVYAAKCLSCHGDKGQGRPADPLVGGIGSLKTERPIRTVGSYWPYASTLFDYTRRAMPANAPMSLSDDETYALSAYILYLNGIITEKEIMNANTLAQVSMPNRAGFIDYSTR